MKGGRRVLTITVQAEEYWDEEAERFVHPESFELRLEHSLVSLSKWEQEFEKPFLAPGDKSTDETLGYIYFMILDEGHPYDVVTKLSNENIEEINAYIDRKMTATWFSETQPEARSSETITSELIYFWMTMFNIPIEWETRHLNNLFTLIRIANIKNSKPKKMSRQEIYERNKRLNQQRREQMGSKG